VVLGVVRLAVSEADSDACGEAVRDSDAFLVVYIFLAICVLWAHVASGAPSNRVDR